MRITMLQALEMFNGLKQLENPKVLKLAATTRWNLTGNLRKLAPFGEDFEDVKKKSIAKFRPDDKDGDRPGFELDVKMLLDREVDVPLHPIKLIELDLEKNDIAINVLAMLGLMIEG